MRARQRLVAFAWTAAATFLAVSALLYLGTSALRRQAAGLRAEASRLEARLRPHGQAPAAAAAVPSKAAPHSGASTQEDGERKPRGPEFLEHLDRDPRTQAAFLRYLRSDSGLRYGTLFRQLRLSTAQVAAFTDAWARKEEDSMDLMASLRATGLTLSDPGAAKMYESIQAAYTEAVAAALGPDGARQVAAYEQELPAREALIGFAGAAAASGIPLSQDQTARLDAIAAQASHPGDGVTPTAGSYPDWARIETQAASVLTPNQLALLSTGEFSGPLGYGSKYQAVLNALISAADDAEMKARAQAAHVP